MEFIIDDIGHGKLVFNDRDDSYFEMDILDPAGERVILVVVSKDDIKRLAKAS